jgi:hypothetical protein
MTIALLFLVFHGVMGGIDVVINHEFKEHLPEKLSAKKEILLHSYREILFAIIFLGLAWVTWHGIWALVIAGVIVAELIVTTMDSLVEDRTRELPGFERIIHILLLINSGIYLALLAPEFREWYSLPSALVTADYGWLSIVLSVLGFFAVAWSIRDAVAYYKMPEPELPQPGL